MFIVLCVSKKIILEEHNSWSKFVFVCSCCYELIFEINNMPSGVIRFVSQDKATVAY
jgi:hypothetical protein